MRRRYPVTTGGITSGRKTTPSSTLLPQKFVRASSQPMPMPNGSANAVATTAIRNDSATAVHSAGVRSNTLLNPPLQGEVKKGQRSRGRLHQNGEAVRFENRLRRLR